MNYYETFKPEIDTLTSKLVGTIKTLSADLPKIKHRLEVEKGAAQSLRDRISDLKKTTGEVYGDQNAYAVFKTNLKKRIGELESSEEAARLIETDVIPKKQGELSLAKTNLKILLDAFLLRSRSIADKKINELLIECITERQNFLDDFTRIYSDCGLNLIISNESFCPGIWSGDVIRDLRLKLGMDASLPIVEAPCAEKVVSGEAQDETSPLDPANTTPEVLSQTEV